MQRDAPDTGSAGRVAALGTAATLALLFAAPIVWVHATWDRALVAYHGFLHAAIVDSVLRTGVPPENPFFAGADLPYYWFFHACAAALRALTGLDALHALELLILASLVALVALCIGIARAFYGSTPRGVLLVMLVLMGGNLLALGIAGVRWAFGDGPFFDDTPLRITSDYLDRSQFGMRLYGPNYIYFFYNTSRGVALAALFGVAAALAHTQRRPGFVPLAVLVGASALATAMSPLIGMAGAGALCGALVLQRLRGSGDPRAWQWILALVTGVLVAFPTYQGLLAAPQGGYAFVLFSAEGAKLVGSVLVGALPLLGLAMLRAPFPGLSTRDRQLLDVLVLAGGALLLAAACFRLPNGNNCNLYLAGITLVALPAAAVRGRRALGVALCIWLAACAAMLVRTHAERTPLGIAFEDGRVTRGADWPAFAAAYAWIDTNTEADAVIVSDPTRRVTLFGNVPELPAMAGRPLFAGSPNYLTTPYPDWPQRRRIGQAAATGAALDAADRETLAALGRPVYVIQYRADSHAALRERHGEPVFRDGRVAIFRVVPEGEAPGG